MYLKPNVKLSSLLPLCLAFLLLGLGCDGKPSDVISSGRLVISIPEPTPTPIPEPTATPEPTPTPIPEPTPTPELLDTVYEQSIERWRRTVRGALSEYGLVDQEDNFMRVLWCESRGDPNALNQESGASGLMQHIPRYWEERARLSGFQGASPFDPVANIYAAVWLLDIGGWEHWECN